MSPIKHEHGRMRMDVQELLKRRADLNLFVPFGMDSAGSIRIKVEGMNQNVAKHLLHTFCILISEDIL